MGRRKKSEGRSLIMTALAVFGLIMLGAIVVPALVGLIAAAPDIARYIRMQRM